MSRLDKLVAACACRQASMSRRRPPMTGWPRRCVDLGPLGLLAIVVVLLGNARLRRR